MKLYRFFTVRRLISTLSFLLCFIVMGCAWGSAGKLPINIVKHEKAVEPSEPPVIRYDRVGWVNHTTRLLTIEKIQEGLVRLAHGLGIPGLVAPHDEIDQIQVSHEYLAYRNVRNRLISYGIKPQLAWSILGANITHVAASRNGILVVRNALVANKCSFYNRMGVLIRNLTVCDAYDIDSVQGPQDGNRDHFALKTTGNNVVVITPVAPDGAIRWDSTGYVHPVGALALRDVFDSNLPGVSLSESHLLIRTAGGNGYVKEINGGRSTIDADADEWTTSGGRHGTIVHHANMQSRIVQSSISEKNTYFVNDANELFIRQSNDGGGIFYSGLHHYVHPLNGHFVRAKGITINLRNIVAVQTNTDEVHLFQVKPRHGYPNYLDPIWKTDIGFDGAISDFVLTDQYIVLVKPTRNISVRRILDGAVVFQNDDPAAVPFLPTVGAINAIAAFDKGVTMLAGGNLYYWDGSVTLQPIPPLSTLDSIETSPLLFNEKTIVKKGHNVFVYDSHGMLVWDTVSVGHARIPELMGHVLDVSPVIGDQKVILLNDKGNAYIRHLANGAAVADTTGVPALLNTIQKVVSTRGRAAFLLKNRNVFVFSLSPFGVLARVWDTTGLGVSFAHLIANVKSVTLSNRVIVLLGNDSNLYAFNPETGADLWSINRGRAATLLAYLLTPITEVLALGGHIVALSNANNCYVLNDMNGGMLWHTDPVPVDGVNGLGVANFQGHVLGITASNQYVSLQIEGLGGIQNAYLRKIIDGSAITDTTVLVQPLLQNSVKGVGLSGDQISFITKSSDLALVTKDGNPVWDSTSVPIAGITGQVLDFHMGDHQLSLLTDGGQLAIAEVDPDTQALSPFDYILDPISGLSFGAFSDFKTSDRWLVARSKGGGYYIFAAQSRRLAWRSQRHGHRSGAVGPVACDGHIIGAVASHYVAFRTDDGNLYLINPRSNHALWDSVTSHVPGVTGNVVDFDLSNQYVMGVADDLAGHRNLYVQPIPNPLPSSGVFPAGWLLNSVRFRDDVQQAKITNTVAAVVNSHRELAIFEAATGNLLWNSSGQPYDGNVAEVRASDEHVVVKTNRNDLYILNAMNGSLIQMLPGVSKFGVTAIGVLKKR